MSKTCLLCKSVIRTVKYSIYESYTKYSNIILQTFLESLLADKTTLISSYACERCNDLLNQLDLAEKTYRELRQKVLDYFEKEQEDSKTGTSKINFSLSNDSKNSDNPNDVNLQSEEFKNKNVSALKKYECHICFRKCISKTGLAIHMRKLHDHLELNNIVSEKKCDEHVPEKVPNTDKHSGDESDNAHKHTADGNEVQNQEECKIDETKTKASAVKIHKCSICPKTWKTLGELKNHLSAHSNIRPYICEVCGQAYKHKAAFQIHVGMHNGIYPFKCSYCNKSFTQKGALQRHLPIHTGDAPFQCDLCGKRFVHHTSFNIHQLSHTGQKDYKCSICELALFSASHLKRHMRVHTGEKNYVCSFCGKRFAERYNLVSHQKLHEMSGSNTIFKRNHRCQVCGMAFNRRLKLDEHAAKVHQTESDNTRFTIPKNETEIWASNYESNRWIQHFKFTQT